jgi:hypothetical protein
MKYASYMNKETAIVLFFCVSGSSLCWYCIMHAIAMHMFGSWFCWCGSTLLGGLPLQLFDKPHIL